MIYPNRSDGRKTHYGDGKQPLDTILELGWAPQFCAGNVVKYLRRSKDEEHSRESAGFYYKLLGKLALKDIAGQHGTKRDCIGANHILRELQRELTLDELSLLPTL